MTWLLSQMLIFLILSWIHLACFFQPKLQSRVDHLYTVIELNWINTELTSLQQRHHFLFREVTCGQVWCPILRICALHFSCSPSPWTAEPCAAASQLWWELKRSCSPTFPAGTDTQTHNLQVTSLTLTLGQSRDSLVHWIIIFLFIAVKLLWDVSRNA